MENFQPEVSIIVLNWNGCQDTIACLESIHKQGNVRCRVILVDNHSSDHTVSSVRQQFPGTQIIENASNLGYAQGNNVGIEAALKQGGDYVLVLNNDTILDPGCIAVLVQGLNAHPPAAAVSPVSYYLSDPERVYFAGGKMDPNGLVGHSYIDKSGGDLPGEAYPAQWLSGCAILFRSAALLDVGLFDPNYFLVFEDTDWSMRAVKAGYQLLIVPQAKIWHKVSASFGEVWNPTFIYYFHRNKLYWIEKNFSGITRIRFFLYSFYAIFYHYFYRPQYRDSLQLSQHRKVIKQAILDYFARKFGKQEIGF